MHSKAKLALAVLTSPRAAFEEILERKLLGTAFVIVALTGLIAMIGAIARVPSSGEIQWFALGKDNPLTWFGLYLLYGLAIHFLVKWLGTEISYHDILIGLGWAQVSLLLAYGIGAIGSLLAVGGASDSAVATYAGPAQAVLEVAYLALAGVAISVAGRTTFVRGLLSYLVIELAAVIAFMQTYSASRISVFHGALPGMTYLAQTVVANDNIPWLGAAVVGLGLGFWTLARELGWDDARRKRLVATSVVIGLAAFGVYTYSVYKTDYYGQLLTSLRFYDRQHYADSAARLTALLPASRQDAPRLMLDLGLLYYLAEKDARSLDYYAKVPDAVKPLNLLDKPMLRAQAHDGMGAVHYIKGDYPTAISEFQKATKEWKEFREPWVRIALAYNRTGDYKKAVENAEHAVKKLGSKATAAQVALLQAYARTGDDKNAKTAYEKIKRADKDLAKRIGDKPLDWNTAVEKLTREDLRFPLEAALAPQPNKKQPAPQPAKKPK